MYFDAKKRLPITMKGKVMNAIPDGHSNIFLEQRLRNRIRSSRGRESSICFLSSLVIFFTSNVTPQVRGLQRHLLEMVR